MRVLFKLRKNVRNPTARATVYCRIKVDGKHANDFSTFVALPPDQWDSKKQRIRGGSLNASNNNVKLEQIRSDITRLFLTDSTLSAQNLADRYTGKKKTSYTFAELLDLFEEQCRANYEKPGTFINYQIRLNNIRAFLSDTKRTALMPPEFNLGVGDEFVRWMKTNKRGHSHTVRHTQVLKNVMAMAIRRELILYDPLAAFVLKKRERINTDHLTRAQLTQLETMPWEGNLRRVADLFLFSCYTGLHYADAQTLTPADLATGPDGRQWLYKTRGKYEASQFFDVPAVQMVPLSKRALALIEQYGGVQHLPKISNSKYNKALKHIRFQANITVNLTVKTARKTFTDVMLNELGLTADAVAVMLGHSSTKHVRHYAKADERRVAKEMENVAW